MLRGGHVILHARDVAGAVRFYVETLGMKLVAEEHGASVLDAGEGFRIELRAGSPAHPASGAPVLALHPKVPVDEAIAVYENRGVAFDVDRTGGEVVARFRDPDGHPLALVGPG